MSKLLGRGNPNRPWSIRAYILKQQPHWHRHSESCEKTPLCTARIWVNSRKLAKFSFVSLHAVSFSGGCIWFLSEDAEGKRGASAHIQSWWILGPWCPGGDGADFRKYKAVENQNPAPTSHPDTHSHPLFLSYIHTHTHTESGSCSSSILFQPCTCLHYCWWGGGWGEEKSALRLHTPPWEMTVFKGNLLYLPVVLIVSRMKLWLSYLFFE